MRPPGPAAATVMLPNCDTTAFDRAPRPLVYFSAMQRVLVVDDEPDIVELLTFNLRAAGYEVISAKDGLEALEQARAQRPDLILLDLMLPELDGISVCEILRRTPGTAAIPIIMLTAWSSELSRVVGLATGADEYMTKPFKTGAVLARVKALLENHTARPAGHPVLG